MTGEIVLWAVNDTPAPVALSVGLTRVDVAGPIATLGDMAVVCPPDRAVEVARVAVGDLAASEFRHFTWIDADRCHSGTNDYLPLRPKEYDLREPTIAIDRDGDAVTLTTDVPALFVTWDHGGDDVWAELLHARARLAQGADRRPVADLASSAGRVAPALSQGGFLNGRNRRAHHAPHHRRIALMTATRARRSYLSGCVAIAPRWRPGSPATRPSSATSRWKQTWRGWRPAS